MDRNDHSPFVEYLEELRDKDNRGALAALRRAIGKRGAGFLPPEACRYVVPWLPTDASAWQESAYFMVASLFASHPSAGGKGSMGSVLGCVAREGGSASTEQRFVALLDSHPDDLAQHLRHAISLAKAKRVPVNWHQLLRDVLAWPHRERYVQRNWARDFWRPEARSAPGGDEQAHESVSTRGEGA